MGLRIRAGQPHNSILILGALFVLQLPLALKVEFGVPSVLGSDSESGFPVWGWPFGRI